MEGLGWDGVRPPTGTAGDKGPTGAIGATRPGPVGTLGPKDMRTTLPGPEHSAFGEMGMPRSLSYTGRPGRRMALLPRNPPSLKKPPEVVELLVRVVP